MVDALQCPKCGAPLEYRGTAPTVECLFCGTDVIVPEALRQAAASPPAATSQFDPQQIQAMLAEVSALVGEGQKIEAIKRLRAVLDIGLKQAKEMVEQIEAGQPVEASQIYLFTNQPMAVTVVDPEELKARLRAFLAEGQKIEAIKLYRETYDTGLKESKEAVEAFERSGFLPTPQTPLTAQVSVALGHVSVIDQVRALAQQGNIIDAAALYQQHFGVSYREARQAVEALTSSAQEVVPVPVKQGAVAAATASGCCFPIALVIFILLITAIPILFGLAQPGGPLAEPWAKLNPFDKARLVLAFGEEGIGAGLLNDPRYLAVDGEGYFYVANFDDGRVQRFDPNGQYQSMWQMTNEDGDDEVYIRAIAADRAGRVYVAKDGEIWIYEGQSGQLLGQLPKPVDENGYSYAYYEDVAVTADGGLVVVSQGENLIRFDASQQIEWLLPDAVSTISKDSELGARVAVDGLGNIYLAGTFNDAVFVFSPTGEYRSHFGSHGDEPGQFWAIHAVVVDGRGYIYVSDTKGIQVFAPDGRYLELIRAGGAAFDLAVGARDQLYTVTNQPRVLQYEVQLP
jgi:ribosomal protein L7/L12/DNA-binding beta-propeller fold protein YncE